VDVFLFLLLGAGNVFDDAIDHIATVPLVIRRAFLTAAPSTRNNSPGAPLVPLGSLPAAPLWLFRVVSRTHVVQGL
jgi:hypothetical protein